MKFINRSQFWLVIGLLMADGLFFGLSDPASVPSLALAIGFILFVVTLYRLLYGLLILVSWYGFSRGKRPRRRLALTVTGLVGGIVALQSIGELAARDVLVLVPLVIGMYVYNSYAVRQVSRAEAGS